MGIDPVVYVVHLKRFHTDTSFDDINEDSTSPLLQPSEAVEPIVPSEDQKISDEMPLDGLLLFEYLTRKLLERMLTTLFSFLTNIYTKLHGFLVLICCYNVRVLLNNTKFFCTHGREVVLLPWVFKQLTFSN
jgi:hypothetical protein